MSIKVRIAAVAAGLCLSLASAMGVAEDHAYTDGPVVNISAIRTINGKFDEYMKWVDTVWKAEQEAAIKAGYETGYSVYSAQPRTLNDPDIYLVITYKNWAALDDMTAKNDALSKQFEGSVDKATRNYGERDSMRVILGSETVQQMNLK